jgi:hypothetical protein
MDKRPRTPEGKQTRYFLFCRLRNQRHSAEDIAVRLLGPDSSPTALYRELGTDGFPVCKMCGAYSADKSFCAKHLKEIEPKRKRRAMNLGGDAIKLPPASEASDLFREAIAELSRLIDPPAPSGDKHGWEAFQEAMEADHNLFRLEEYLQGEHIVSYSIEDRGNVPVIYRKITPLSSGKRRAWKKKKQPHKERSTLSCIRADNSKRCAATSMRSLSA